MRWQRVRSISSRGHGLGPSSRQRIAPHVVEVGVGEDHGMHVLYSETAGTQELLQPQVDLFPSAAQVHQSDAVAVRNEQDVCRGRSHRLFLLEQV